jgi:hypothetical protein
MNKENTTLVVSYYNSKEFLNIVDLFKDTCNIIVYNKSDNDVEDSRFKTMKLPNLGKEAHNYLFHIVNNFDTLTDYTIFIQDDTHNHIPNYEKFYNDCNNMITNNIHFYVYPCGWRQGNSPGTRTIVNGVTNLHTLENHGAIGNYCNELNIKLPTKYTTNLCAFLICSKKSILDNNKSEYEKIIEFCIEKHDLSVKNPSIHPFWFTNAFEHIWERLFNKAKYFSN